MNYISSRAPRAARHAWSRVALDALESLECRDSRRTYAGATERINGSRAIARNAGERRE